MRLFSDRGSDPRRARRIIIAAEAGAAAAVVVAGIGGPASAGGLESGAAIAIWAVIPRFTGAWLERLSPGPGARERDLRRFQGSAVGAALVALAGVFATIWLPAIASAGGAGRFLIILFWAAGFFVLDRTCRRGFEILGAAVLVQGIWRTEWSAIPFVAAAVFGFGLASALRRQLEVDSAPRRRRVMVQNAAVLALLLALVVSVAFLGLGAAAQVFDLERGGTGPEGVAAVDPLPGKPAAGQSAGGRLPGAGSAPGMGDPTRGGVGLRRQGDTGDEDRPDPVVLRVGQGLSSPLSPVVNRWSPEPTTLWKVRTFATFDPLRQEWLEAAADERVTLTFPGCRALVESPVSDEMTFGLRVTVAAERLGMLVLPYATDEVDLSGLGSPVADLHANPEGDLACRERPLVLGDHYGVRFRPMEAGDRSLLRPLPGSTTTSGEHLVVPTREELRVDLDRMAAEIFQGATTLESRIEQIERWFQANLAHVRTVQEIAPPENLADFLVRTRVGDCRHLATAAALLLRAAGVPTRLAAGFAGAVPDPVAGGWSIPQSQTHAWIEVQVPGRGFVPLDPSEWVSSGLPPVPSATGAVAPGAPSPPSAAPSPEGPGPVVLLLGLAAAAAMILFVFWRPPRRRQEEGDGEVEPARVPGRSAAEALRVPPFLPSTPAGHLVLAYDDLQQHLARSDVERLDHETPTEHAARVAAGSGVRCRAAFGTLMPLLYSGLYGQQPLSEADVAHGKSAIATLRRTF